MKLHYVAAATLMLSTSALAWAPSSEPVATASKDTAAFAAADAGAKAPAVVLVAKSVNLPAIEGDPALVETASAPAAKSDPMAEGDPDLDLAVNPDDVDSGMGGPLELADAAAAPDFTPRPAAGNYPACAPGPGDDNCIQLYEPGVRAQLAGWSQPTGGLIGDQEVAMGGPYEPVAESPKDGQPAGDSLAVAATEPKATLEAGADTGVADPDAVAKG